MVMTALLSPARRTAAAGEVGVRYLSYRRPHRLAVSHDGRIGNESDAFHPPADHHLSRGAVIVLHNPKPDRKPRSAALLATLFAAPIFVVFMLVLILVFKPGGSGSVLGSTPSTNAGALPAITAAAPPNGAANAATCATLIGALPVPLTGLGSRAVHTTPDSPFVVAWGEPPIVLSCGVNRPAGLVPGAADYVQLVNGVPFWVDHNPDGSISWTAIDRAPYIKIDVPAVYAGGPISPIADAIGASLPAVCKVDPAAPTDELCTHRP
jgi:hypothetical protein